MLVKKLSNSLSVTGISKNIRRVMQKNLPLYNQFLQVQEHQELWAAYQLPASIQSHIKYDDMMPNSMLVVGRPLITEIMPVVVHSATNPTSTREATAYLSSSLSHCPSEESAEILERLHHIRISSISNKHNTRGCNPDRIFYGLHNLRKLTWYFSWGFSGGHGDDTPWHCKEAISAFDDFGGRNAGYSWVIFKQG